MESAARDSASSVARLRTVHDVPRALARGASACIVRRAPGASLRVAERHLPEAPFTRAVPLGSGFSPRDLSNGAFPERLARALERDISELRDSLCSITGDLDGKAELSVVTGAECPKFHVDYYVLRLLVTYVGLGTELLRAEAVDWSALGTGGDDFEQANRRIVRDRRGLVRARAGDIVVLRGAKGSGRGAVHRSPPTDRSGIRRLLLKLTVT